ncbi:MAG TPA: LPS assembly lipoprotein LptE [Chthoniobacterales bacterium]|nr:LPS assembly lipoprotein LptE [Chthoniobacterales bacterium]
MKNIFGAVIIACCLGGCLGYTIGPVKPNYLSDVHTIAVPTFRNHTLMPRIEVMVTDTVIKQFQQDGTFKIGNEQNADAILKADITRIVRAPARSLRGNVLATTEFTLLMRVKYKLEGRDGTPIGPPGEVQGTTSFFVGRDVVTDERQALPLATEDVATHLVAQLSEGW